MLNGKDTYFLIKDISTGGTYINKRRIEQASLKNRQVIKMGNTEFVYHERR
jgi:pSer/pThr/pTyr-binding forkhead associated (FHA) protein